MKALLVSILLFSSLSYAKPRICFLEKHSLDNNLKPTQLSLMVFDSSNDVVFENLNNFEAPRCESLKRAQALSQVLQISLGIGGVVMGCTGAGLPATALVGSAMVGLEVFDFIVDQIPCIDVERDQMLQSQVRGLICAELRRSGYVCEEDQLN